LAADRLQPMAVAAGGELGQHPLQRQLVQQLRSSERLPGRQGQLGGAVGAAHPWPLDPDPAPTQGDPAGLGAVADRSPGGVWRPLGPTSRSTSASSRLPSTPRPIPTARRGALAGGAGQLGEGDGDPVRAGPARRRRAGSSAYPSAGGGSPSGRAAWRLPDTYHTAGIRRGTATSSSTKPGTTS
jgi:hypothetical protein